MMEYPNLTYALETTLVTGATPPIPITPPAPMISMPLPLSYQFQVVEYTDESGNVVKVELQVQQTCHDQYGNVKIMSGFKPVPRIQLPLLK
jgi:hypothetical protein